MPNSVSVDEPRSGGNQGLGILPCTSTWYRKVFGWAAENTGGGTTLALGRNTVAVSVPAAMGPHVAAALRALDSAGPVVLTPTAPPAWLFLADPNGQVAGRDDVPSGVVVLDCPTRITIPSVDQPAAGTCWVIPPSPSRRWLPTLAAVICGLHCHRGDHVETYRVRAGSLSGSTMPG